MRKAIFIGFILMIQVLNGQEILSKKQLITGKWISAQLGPDSVAIYTLPAETGWIYYQTLELFSDGIIQSLNDQGCYSSTSEGTWKLNDEGQLVIQHEGAPVKFEILKLDLRTLVISRVTRDYPKYPETFMRMSDDQSRHK